MRKRTRYYSDHGDDVGLTPSELKRRSRETQIEYMTFWFHQYFEDPASETPYNSAEGGYMYIWGGPYDAAEQLGDEFGNFIAQDRIEEAVRQVESGGTIDWAPGDRHPDHERARAEAAAEREDEESAEPHDALATLREQLNAGASPRYGSRSELAQRNEIVDRLDQLEQELAKLKPMHGGIGHNNPPPEEPDVSPNLLEDTRAASQRIRSQLEKPTPDAIAIAEATASLRSFAVWLAKKADGAVDGFIKAPVRPPENWR